MNDDIIEKVDHRATSASTTPIDMAILHVFNVFRQVVWQYNVVFVGWPGSEGRNSDNDGENQLINILQSGRYALTRAGI